MFSLPANGNYMQENGPPVVFSSFSAVLPKLTPYQDSLPTSVDSMALSDEKIEVVCAEIPEKLKLADAIWQSKVESPGDLGDSAREVKEKRFQNELIEKDVLRSPSWSPLPPVFQSNSVREEFVTPQLVETQRATLSSEQIAEPLFNAWLGTNVIVASEWTIEQSKAILQDAITRRAAIEMANHESPYDPEGWLGLTSVYFELCFNDLQVASAHKAIYLINQGLDLKDQYFGKRVRDAVGIRLSCFSTVIITDELQNGLVEAYKGLLRGLLEMGAYWEGLKEAKEALEVLPGNKDILFLQRMIKEEYRLRAAALKESKHSAEDIKQLSRVGRTYKRKYPWLEENLFNRSQSHLEEINKNFNSTNCEVRSLFATKSHADAKISRTPQHFAINESNQCFPAHRTDSQPDIGPLGIFTKRAIRKNEILLTDHNLTIVPVTPLTNTLLHCDACHALLTPPFHDPSSTNLAPCCPTTTAFCSTTCQTAALTGYHAILCGQDFTWLHRSATYRGLDRSWQPSALLRIFAVVVADLRSLPPTAHPLQHPLLARLTAGYQSQRAEHAGAREQEHAWNYFSHVVAPTRILAQLGVDVFADKRWSAEVVHCVYWRVVNNACCVRACTLAEGSGLERVQMSGIAPGYVFFNHTCASDGAWWAGAGSVEGVARCRGGGAEKRKSVESAEEDREVKIGSNALLCVARRDYKKGEEVRISYLPPGKRQQLGKWFEDGKCTCGDCDGELVNQK